MTNSASLKHTDKILYGLQSGTRFTHEWGKEMHEDSALNWKDSNPKTPDPGSECLSVSLDYGATNCILGYLLST